MPAAQRRRAGALALALLALGATLAPAARAAEPLPAAEALLDATRAWTPAESASIRPGVRTHTRGASHCTANFVYTDAADNVYLGQAAHCSRDRQTKDMGGCGGQSLPLGTEVEILGTDVVGRMVYNSWLTMREQREKDLNACAYNDLALIQIPVGALNKVNPTIPLFGGPTGVSIDGTDPGDRVLSYANPTRDRVAPKVGASLGTVGEGWSHTVYALTPGIPGDSGAPILDDGGRALGELTSLSHGTAPLSNQVSDLAHQMAYAQTYVPRLSSVRVAAGTEPFLGTGLK